MSSDFPTLINRLFTALLLVVLLYACQEIPDSRNVEETQLDHQTN